MYVSSLCMYTCSVMLCVYACSMHVSVWVCSEVTWSEQGTDTTQASSDATCDSYIHKPSACLEPRHGTWCDLACVWVHKRMHKITCWHCVGIVVRNRRVSVCQMLCDIRVNAYDNAYVWVCAYWCICGVNAWYDCVCQVYVIRYVGMYRVYMYA